MSIIIVNITGLFLIGLIVWWFWFSRPASKTASSGIIEVIAEGGSYTPSVIEASAGAPITLRFIRRDPSPCAEKVIFSDFKISQDLAVDEPSDLVINATAAGTYEFTCQMGMYRGKLIVK